MKRTKSLGFTAAGIAIAGALAFPAVAAADPVFGGGQWGQGGDTYGYPAQGALTPSSAGAIGLTGSQAPCGGPIRNLIHPRCWLGRGR